MAYSVKAFPTDRYDRKCTVFKTFRDVGAMWHWVFEYLHGGKRKVIVSYHGPRQRWRGMMRQTVRTVGVFTEPGQVPKEFWPVLG